MFITDNEILYNLIDLDIQRFTRTFASLITFINDYWKSSENEKDTTD